MRRLLAIAALMLVLLFAAAPAEASCGSDGDVAVAAVVAQGGADVLATAMDGHCPHVPCSDTTHSHTPGGCAGHSFVPTFAPVSLGTATAAHRVAFTHVAFNGRTLLPPVPPPLA